MAQLCFTSITRLKNKVYGLNQVEIKAELSKLDKEVEDFLQKKLIPRELVQELHKGVLRLQRDLPDLDKAGIKTRLEELDDEAAGIEDAGFFMQAGTGEYLANMRKAAEKKKKENK
ncbi:MAG: hypothetical protein ACQEQG_07090 [Bacillota bacterium]